MCWQISLYLRSERSQQRNQRVPMKKARMKQRVIPHIVKKTSVIEEDTESSSDDNKIMKQAAVSHKSRWHVKDVEVPVSDKEESDEE